MKKMNIGIISMLLMIAMSVVTVNVASAAGICSIYSSESRFPIKSSCNGNLNETYELPSPSNLSTPGEVEIEVEPISICGLPVDGGCNPSYEPVSKFPGPSNLSVPGEVEIELDEGLLMQ